MNEDTKQILKWGSVFLASAVIGGFIGGILGNCCSHCKCMHHMHMHMHKGMPGHGVPGGHHRFMHPQGPEFQGEFIEEEYFMVPGGPAENMKQPPKAPEGKPGKKPPMPVKKPQRPDALKPEKAE